MMTKCQSSYWRNSAIGTVALAGSDCNDSAFKSSKIFSSLRPSCPFETAFMFTEIPQISKLEIRTENGPAPIPCHEDRCKLNHMIRYTTLRQTNANSRFGIGSLNHHLAPQTPHMPYVLVAGAGVPLVVKSCPPSSVQERPCPFLSKKVAKISNVKTNPCHLVVVCPSKPAKRWRGPAIVNVVDLIDKFSRPTANMFPFPS